MTLREWMNGATPPQRTKAAKRAKTTVGYLWQIAGGHRKPSPAKASAIEAATGVAKATLRPDIWQ